MKIICYGDSNTYGYNGDTVFGDRFPETERWPELLGQMLGCGACMSSLVRTNTCGYSLEQALSLEDLRSMNAEQIEALLDPPETAVSHLPRLELGEEQSKLFINGNPVWSDGLTLSDEVQAAFHNNKLIGIVRDQKIAKVL